MPRDKKEDGPLVYIAPESTAKATPENTPPPGGGRWRWDITKPGWMDVDAQAEPAFPELPAE